VRVGLLSILTLGGSSLAFAQQYTFTTLAGAPDVPGWGSADGTGSAARFYYPNGVAVDSAGVVYVADSGNNTIRRITPAGVVTTLAGLAGTFGSADGTGSGARFSGPGGVAVDSAGVVYVADTTNCTIRKVTPAGVVTTLAGLAGARGSADGTGSAARFAYPNGVAVDTAGVVYVADTVNSTIRKITPAGVVTTLAGLAGTFGSADGTGTGARFSGPGGVAVDSAGVVYVADRNNNTIRKVTSAGVVTTLAGLAGAEGSADGTGSGARFFSPDGVAVDSAGIVYVSDLNNRTIREVTAAGVVTTLAGLAGTYDSTDGTGSAARFREPRGVAVDSVGVVYVADSSNWAIRKITPAGVVTTLAGWPGVVAYGSADGTGSAARFAYPGGVAVDSAGVVYVADSDNFTIRKVTPAGVVTTLAGLAGAEGSANGTGSAARFSYPFGVAVDSAGVVYVADSDNNTIRKITAAGVVTTLAGLAGASGGADGTGSGARFNSPQGVAVDSAGVVYIGDTGSHTIRRITPAGVVTTLAGLAGAFGSADGTGSGARFFQPKGVAVDSAGVVYVADVENHTIRRITPAGVVTTLAGVAGTFGSADGTGSGARFFYPYGVAVDSASVVYVADGGNNTIRRITPAGVVTTLAGLAGTKGSADGVGTAALFSGPYGVAAGAGAVYVGDLENCTIRKGDAAPAIVTQPANQTVAPGETATFTVAASGNPAYQWQVSTNGGSTWTDMTDVAPYSGVTTTTLTVTAATVGLGGNQYRAVATNSTGTATSNAATITVGTSAAITSQPLSQTIASGLTATVSVVATGTAPFNYQWYQGTSGTTTTPIGGATASTYTTPALVSPTSYWVRVSNGIGSAVDSTTATIAIATNSATAQMITPAPMSTLRASRVAFQWTGGRGVSEYYLWVGSTIGGGDLFSQDQGTNLSTTVTGLPVDGRTVFVRLWSLIGPTWLSRDYTYTAATSAPARAQLMTPVPGSTLSASTVAFQWTGGTGVSWYYLWVGSTDGANDVASRDCGPSLSATLTELPADGRTLYVRLWSLIGGVWQSYGYTHTARTTSASSLAEMIAPAPGSTLTASTVAFQWTGGTGAYYYYLWVGSTVGASDLASQGGTNLADTVTGLPSDGRTLYVRLWSLVDWAWQPHDYTYTAMSTSVTPRAQMTTPAPESTLPASAVAFQWSGGAGVAQYYLWVGNTVGANDLASQDRGTSLNAIVRALPTDGRTLFVRLWSLLGGGWQSNDYTYVAASSAPARAQMTSPSPGSTLTASTVEFKWTGGAGVAQYYLWVGTTGAGSNNLANQDRGTNLGAIVTGLPTNGSTVNVRLWSLVGGAWQPYDYTYSATTPTLARAQMVTPAPGSTLAASTVMFQWTGGTGVTQYVLWVGTTGAGSSNVPVQDEGTSLSGTVTGLPTNGSTIYVRLWSLVGGAWQFYDYTYSAP
jgi:hypothetical protein